MHGFNPTAPPAKDPLYPSRSACKVTSKAAVREYNGHFDRSRALVENYLAKTMAISGDEKFAALRPLLDHVVEEIAVAQPNKASISALAANLGLIVARLATSAPSGRDRHDVFRFAGVETTMKALNHSDLREDQDGDDIERTPAMFQRELTAFVSGLTSTAIALGLITPEGVQRAVTDGLKSGVEVGDAVHMRQVRREVTR